MVELVHTYVLVGKVAMIQNTDNLKPSEKILNAAFECLSTRGYANVSMRNIADEAGVALGQMTYYYKSKEALFLEVIDRMTLQYLKEVEEQLDSATDQKQKLEALIGFFRGLLKHNPRLLKLLIDFTAQALWVPAFREQLDTLYHRLTELIERNLVLDMKTDRRSLGHSSQSVAKLILGALNGISIQIMLDYDREDSFESLFLTERLLG